jgi:hypothetical protein
MKKKFETFIFDDFSFDKKTKKLEFRYALDDEIFFTEKICFDFEINSNFSEEAFKKAAFGAFVMSGISYFKTYLPPKIVFKNHKITNAQKYFFTKIYENGLGEFFFQNKISSSDKINFELGVQKEGLNSELAVNIKNLNGSLVAFGGGKDSIVTAEILKLAGEEFKTFCVGNSLNLQKAAKKLDVENLQIRRELSPNLFELNKSGALNGHVPISSILAFLGVCVAILQNKKNVIFSNEHSANEATVRFENKDINHQYSKTIEFEQDFQNYVREFISLDLNYFSFLRPLSELKIARIFIMKFFDKWQNDFSSCNCNFKISAQKKGFFWCGECPKCAFVFLIFSPFLAKDKLIKLFKNKNLFIDSKLKKTFKQLFGLEKQKPFECVGEVSESRQAAILARKDFPELEKFITEFPNILDSEKIISDFYSHIMPKKFEKILYKFLNINK